MAKRLTESFKLQEAGVRRKLKKERWEKTLPSFKNLNIDNRFKEDFQHIELSITNLLNIEERPCISRIVHVSPYGSNFLITNIECPFCGKQVNINRYWNCYICESCIEHEKKIFEIKYVIKQDPKKVKELPAEGEF